MRSSWSWDSIWNIIEQSINVLKKFRKVFVLLKYFKTNMNMNATQ